MLVVRAIGLGLGLVGCSGLAAAESWRARPLVDCSFGYSAEVCASDLNPGFEFIPVDGPILLTGETLEADAVVHTFRVEVELAITGARDADAGPTLNDALSTIEAVLGHPRGWTARGDLAFQHVASATPALTILIAVPETVDRLCAPLDTEGFFSCRIGQRAVLNVERWRKSMPHWTAGLEEYRAYLINHEVGHFLGKGHLSCPEPDTAAPVMQQQSIDLAGCKPNGWPYC